MKLVQILLICMLTVLLTAHAQAADTVCLSSDEADVWTIQGNNGPKENIAVPHIMNWYGEGYDTEFESTTFTYERKFDVPDEIQRLPGKFIRFERSNWRTTVYVNGKEVGAHDGGFHAFDIDITNAVKANGNILKVVVEDYHCMVGEPHGPNKKSTIKGVFGFVASYDFLRGLHDHVYLVGRENVYLDEYYAWGTLRGKKSPAAQEKKTIHARTGIRNASDKTVKAKAVYTFRGGKAEKVLESKSVKVAAGATETFDIEEAWDDPKLWWPHDPFLYDTTVHVEIDGEIMDEETFEFGFRDFYCRNENMEPYKDEDGNVIGDMWLNGKRIRLRGDSYFYDPWPKKGILTSRVWDGEGLEEMMARSKAHNINAIRLHGGEFPKSFLRVADRMGMLIIYELFSGSHPIGKEKYYYDYSNPELWERAAEQFVGKTKDLRQHASLVLWSGGNEVRFMSRRTGMDKTDPVFLNNLADLADPICDNDPAREVYFEADLDYLHPHNDRLFIVSGHYLNAAEIVNRTGSPNISPWNRMVSDTHWYEGAETSQEFYRRENDFPFGVGEYFWCGDPAQIPRAQLYGGFQVQSNAGWGEPVRNRGNSWLRYHQNMNYRTFRNWDHFGNFATVDNKYALATMKEAYRPVVAYCRNHSDAFFEGQTVTRNLVIINDSLDDLTLELRVSVTCGEREIYSESKPFDMPAGELTEHSFEFDVPELRLGSELTIRFDLYSDGVALDENERVCTVFPKAKDLPATDVLMIKERADGQYNDDDIRKFLDEGGTVLFLAEDPDVLHSPSWLDLELSFPVNLSKKPFHYCLGFKSPPISDPLLDALVDTDFISSEPNSTVPYGDLRLWGNDNLIAKKCIGYVKDESFTALVRATGGRLRKPIANDKDRSSELQNVLLAKIKQGEGTVIYSTLLLLEKFDEAPAAARILSLLLNKPSKR